MWRDIARRCVAAGAVVVLATTLTPAAAEPPPTVGTAPVSDEAVRGLGKLVGRNGSSQTTCRVAGRPLLVTTGDFTAYVGPSGTSRPARRVVVTNARTGAFIWAPREVDGWVQTSHCAHGRIYFGGSFHRFHGQRRPGTAAVDATSFRLLRWTVPAGQFNGAEVRSIVSGNGAVFVAGGAKVARVDKTTGAVAWSRSFDCGVRALVQADRFVYAGGFFNTIIRPGARPIRARGLAKLKASTGAPTGLQPQGSKANRASCRTPYDPKDPTARYSGANPLALAHDRERGRIVACEGGISNRVRSVGMWSGRNVWVRLIDGDGQVCVIVGRMVFVGFHRANPLARTHNWGAMGAFLHAGSGLQAAWQPDPDFTGYGPGRDGRNRGIIGAVYVPVLRRLYVTGSFDQVDGLLTPKLAAFAVG
ncbi:hypothetical protein [Nocardioides speluncae]|uniref:hypothetical protein n=1 Tax=Nocardioides speluncae TaxID=2670337 RepID=UPI000D6947CF|nr:hypothetical protein [Nocardioides speluncae]